MALFQMPLMYAAAVALIVETLMCLQQESRWIRLETFFFVVFFFLQLSAGSNFNSLTCSYSR